VSIGSNNLVRFISPEGSVYLDTTRSSDVGLDIMEGVVVLTQLERRPSMTVLLVEAIRNSTGGLRILGEDILPNGSEIKFLIVKKTRRYPERIVVFQVSPWISLESVHGLSELGGIPGKEDRRVKEDPVQDPLRRLQFDSKPMGVSDGIC
jgi:hypothetical protein